MPGISTKVVSHCLAIRPSAKQVAQRKRKVGEEKRITIDEEVEKLSNITSITKTKYLTWLAIIVLVREANNKWCMCADFTYLNDACLKDPYSLPDIDCITDESLGYNTLSFMDAYLGYNQI